MRVLILGGSGLIGHKLWQQFRGRFASVFAIIHGKKQSYEKYGLFNDPNIIEKVDIIDFRKLEGIFQALNPDVILNCIGITKRKNEINNPLMAIAVNSLFPHRLADWAGKNNKRIIHFSTDCVFDGKEGHYTESSLTTAEDAYGRTKALGEINYNHTLTIRSSFIGRELSGRTELLEWLLAQKNKTIKGYKKAMYTGVSTIFMTKVVGDIIENYPNLSGLYQLATDDAISKYDLLCLARDAYDVSVDIIPDEAFEIKPTLDGTKLKKAINLSVPSWKEMMKELASETMYNI